MIWLLIAVGLGLAGLPWFVAIALSILGFLLYVGLDSLVLILEFSRVSEFTELLSVPLLLWCAALLSRTTQRPGPADGFPHDTGGFETWSGRWLLPGQANPAMGASRAQSRLAAPAFLLVPGTPLILTWMMVSVVSPGRNTELQSLFLAGLMPALAVVSAVGIGLLCCKPMARPRLRGGFLPSMAWAVVVVMVTGVLAGRWEVLEAAAAAAVVLTIPALASGRLQPRQALVLAQRSLRDFGALALLFSIGLAWTLLVFDSGIDRNWMVVSSLPDDPSYAQTLVIGVWVSAVWMVAVRLLRAPLPVLILGAPWILPAAVDAGLPPETLILITVLALYAGHLLSLHREDSGQGTRFALYTSLAALVALVLVPPFSLCLPALAVGGS